jgi:hypothetical protein
VRVGELKNKRLSEWLTETVNEYWTVSTNHSNSIYNMFYIKI